MNIPKEHIKLLRGNIESVMQGLNSLGNILILAEEDELTEQCGVNTSNSFNTPPPRPAFLERDIKNVSEGVLHPSDMKLGEDWTVYTLKFKCNQCAAEWSFLSEIPSDNSGCPRGACGGFVASYHSESHSLNTLKKEKQEFFEDFGDEDEDEVVPGVGKTQTPDPKFTPKPPGELDPEIWKCKSPEEPVLIFPTPSTEEALAMIKDMSAKLDQASRPTDEDISKMCEEVAANVASGESHEDKETCEANGCLCHEEDEEPRGADPVERLLDYISEAFTDEHCQTRPPNDTKNWYPGGMDQLCAPSHLHHLADAAQDFLDKRVEPLEKRIEGLEEIAKRYRPDLDVLDEFPKLHFKNVHVIRLLLWELGVGRENKTD